MSVSFVDVWIALLCDGSHFPSCPCYLYSCWSTFESSIVCTGVLTKHQPALFFVFVSMNQNKWMRIVNDTNLCVLSNGCTIFMTGFRMNASSWPMFLLRTLNGAEMAPATAFKKVRSYPSFKALVRLWTGLYSLYCTNSAFGHFANFVSLCTVYVVYYLCGSVSVFYIFIPGYLWGLRNLPNLPRAALRLGWSWRPWTRRTPISSAQPPSGRWREMRFSSCSTDGVALSTTGADMTHETFSP